MFLSQKISIILAGATLLGGCGLVIGASLMNLDDYLENTPAKQTAVNEAPIVEEQFIPRPKEEEKTPPTKIPVIEVNKEVKDEKQAIFDSLKMYKQNIRSNEGRNKSKIVNSRLGFDYKQYKQDQWDLSIGKFGHTRRLPGAEAYFGNQQYKTLWDYSVKLFHHDKTDRPAPMGTAWILDFELPKNPNLYPLTWYFATNMHVLKRINAYVLLGDMISNEERNYEYGLAPSHHLSDVFIARAPLSEDKKRSVPITKKDYVKLKNKEVAFVARNYLKDYTSRNYEIYTFGDDHSVQKNNENYYLDFGVLEATFANEEDARKVTANWFDNYISYDSKTNKYVEKEGSQHINFEAPSVTTKTAKQLKDEYELFVGGYPASHKYGPWGPAVNYWSTHKYQNFGINQFPGLLKDPDDKTIQDITYINDEDVDKLDWKRGSRFTYDEDQNYKFNLDNEYGEILIGVMDANRSRLLGEPAECFTRRDAQPFVAQHLYWKCEVHFPWGLQLLITNIGLAGGSSGSLVIDQNFNFIGIHSAAVGDANGYNHAVTAVKAPEIWEYGRNISMEYDLIFGTSDKQTRSHRIFVEKYKKNTWFAQRYGWDVKEEASK